MNLHKKNLRVLGIDPGYERLGLAVLEKNAEGKISVIYSTCFQTSSKSPFEERVFVLGEEIRRLLNTYQPSLCALESLFFNTNQKTAINVASVRGVILFLAQSSGVQTREYTPLQIKIAVTGYGRSSKNQMVEMVKRLVPIKKEIKHDDEYDAVAVGITCLAQEKI